MWTWWPCGAVGGRSLAPRCPWVCSGRHLLFWELRSSLPGRGIALWVPSVEIYWCWAQGPSIRVGTSASESLTTSSPSSWPRHPITPPNVGFLLPHKRALSQDPCHREPERLRKASVRNSICSVSGTVPYSLMWAPRSFFPRPTGRGHLPCTFKSYFLMNLTHLVCSPAV